VARPGGCAESVIDSAPTLIVVELIPGVAPIRGCVRTQGEQERPFTGWTGLFAALRAAAGRDGGLDLRRDPESSTGVGDPGQ
jgi:hypothetical protein